MNRTALEHLVATSACQARSRVMRLGVVAGCGSAACTSLVVAVVWLRAHYETELDSSSWAFVGAYVITVCAAPLIVLTVVGATLSLRTGTVAEVGATLAMSVAALTSVVGLWLAQLLLRDAGTSTTIGTGWDVAFAASFALAALLPWLLVGLRAVTSS